MKQSKTLFCLNKKSKLSKEINMIDEITPEDIDRHYDSCMDSVNLINKIKAKEKITAQDQDTIDRNVEHLKIMLKKDFWTDKHDLTPIEQAVA